MHMKLLSKDFKKPILLIPEEEDDLWLLYEIIDSGDFVKAMGERKIKIGDGEERKQSIVKRKVIFEIQVEKLTFLPEQGALRINGTISNDIEDIAKGSYQSLVISKLDKLSVKKKEWMKFQTERLKAASKEKETKILICIFDREEAHFFRLKRYGYEYLSSLQGDVEKKAVAQKVKKNFFMVLKDRLKDYDERLKLQSIILASPSFWKDELVKELSEDLLKKCILATSSSAHKQAITEVLQRPELKKALEEQRSRKEIDITEQLLSEISKDGKATYGEKEIKNAVDSGAVETLLITNSLLQKAKENGNMRKYEELFKSIEQNRGAVMIINSSHDAGKQLEGLGGVAALLRFKLT